MPKSDLLEIRRGVQILSSIFRHHQVNVVSPGQPILHKKMNYVHQRDQVAQPCWFVNLQLAVTRKHQIPSEGDRRDISFTALPHKFLAHSEVNQSELDTGVTLT